MTVEDLTGARTNAQNDALLHRLVHTHLLSGSTNPDLDMSSAQRKKDLAGRVLEVAGKAKLGKGEGTVRTLEQKRAAKRVREGIALKQKERNQRELEEVRFRKCQDSASSLRGRVTGKTFGKLSSNAQAIVWHVLRGSFLKKEARKRAQDGSWLLQRWHPEAQQG